MSVHKAAYDLAQNFVFADEATSLSDSDYLYVVDTSTGVGKKVAASAMGMRLSEQSADPDDPSEGQSIFWQSDGTGTGADGDILAKVTAGGETWSGSISITLEPSGDETGAADTAAINAAVARLLASNPLYDVLPTLHLGEGRFYTNELIDMCGASDFTGAPVRLVGSQSTSIKWAGGALGTGEQAPYMFRWCPKHERRNRTALMVDVFLDCNNLARGALFANCWYYTLMQRCMIGNSRQSGFDATRAFGSTIIDATVISARGFCCRMTEAHNAKTIGLQLNGRGDSDLDADEWPATDDTTMLNYPSGSIQSPEAERSAWRFDGRGSIFLASSFEGSNYDDKPALYIAPGSTQNSSRNLWDGIWWESTSFSSHRIYIAATEGVLRSVVFARNDGSPTTATDSFIKIYGASEGVTVQDSEIGKINDYLFETLYGTHTKINVIRTRTIDASTSLEFARDSLVGGTHVTALDELVGYAPAPVEIADDDTAISTDNLRGRLLYMASSTTGRAPTVPTGSTLYYFMNFVGASLDWTFINTGDQTVTITQNTGHTLVGNMAISAGESASFRTRVSAANTAITYRL